MISQITPDGQKPSEARDIDRRLGMAGADQHAAVAGHQRKHMAGADNIAEILLRIYSHGYGVRAVVGGNAGRDAFPGLDGDGERGGVPGLVRPGHGVEMQRVRPLRRDGKADQAAAEARHEIDRVRGRHLSRDDEIAFVLAVLGVHEDEHPALPGVLKDLFGGGKLPVDFVLIDSAQVFVLHGFSVYCPNSLAT